MDNSTNLGVRMCRVAEGNGKRHKDRVLVGVSTLGKEKSEIESE